MTCIYINLIISDFYKEFYNQRKIFYKFDCILHEIKYLKMEKYISKNILLSKQMENKTWKKQ